MKIILSRKGFDSSYGGMPSPILPDGTLLSMPIPLQSKQDTYDKLIYNGKTYANILNELNRKQPKEDFCHVDPDIYQNIRKDKISNRKATFGQSDAAFSHLENQGIKEGDLFLFFGWFKQTKSTPKGKLYFEKNAPNLHVIYGYLQIGEIYKGYEEIKNSELKYHPHYGLANEKNAIYVASEKLMSIDGLREKPGYGTFKLKDELILTKNEATRSKWALKGFFKNKFNISYHSNNSWKNEEEFFQSAHKGQEFVFDLEKDNDGFLEILKGIIGNKK